jgi:hypothetical protein
MTGHNPGTSAHSQRYKSTLPFGRTTWMNYHPGSVEASRFKSFSLHGRLIPQSVN